MCEKKESTEENRKAGERKLKHKEEKKDIIQEQEDRM